MLFLKIIMSHNIYNYNDEPITKKFHHLNALLYYYHNNYNCITF